MLLVLTLVLVRPISGRVSELDGLMLLTVGLVWVALQVGELIRVSVPWRQRSSGLQR